MEGAESRSPRQTRSDQGFSGGLETEECQEGGEGRRRGLCDRGNSLSLSGSEPDFLPLILRPRTLVGVILVRVSDQVWWMGRHGVQYQQSPGPWVASHHDANWVPVLKSGLIWVRCKRSPGPIPPRVSCLGRFIWVADRNAVRVHSDASCRTASAFPMPAKAEPANRDTAGGDPGRAEGTAGSTFGPFHSVFTKVPRVPLFRGCGADPPARLLGGAHKGHPRGAHGPEEVGPVPTSKSTSKSTTKRPSKPGQESPTRPFRGTFALLPPEATRWQCEGQCGRTLPRAKFPTTARGMHPLVGRVVSAPERRTAECRECRNERQGREERALERAAAAALSN